MIPMLDASSDRKRVFSMFLDALSTALLQICNEENLSYEAAAEKVGCSPEFFGRIIRKRSSPTITYFERLCRGFERTPNQLLGISDSVDELLHRIPMCVTKMRVIPAANLANPVCPRCNCSLEREYQAFCDRCGQHLLWCRFYRESSIIISSSQEYNEGSATNSSNSR